MRVVKSFLNLLSIKYNPGTVDRFLKVHPDNPSILSFSELMDEFKIPNAGIRIDKENFPQIPVPFICKTASDEGDFCLVKKLSPTEITYLNEKNEWKTRPLDIFFMQYQGAVLVAEPNDNSSEPYYRNTRKKNFLKNAAVFLLALILLLAIGRGLFRYLQQAENFNFSLLPFSILQLMGLAVSTLLVMQSLNLNNDFINNLCSSASGNGCKNILSSDAAKVPFLDVSWSETGIVFFLANIITLSFANNGIIQWLSLVSIAAMGYPVYSIYYQYAVAKVWCRLCLAVQFVLLSSGVLMGFFLWKHFSNPLAGAGEIAVYALVFVSVVLLWYISKPFLLLNIKIDKLASDMNVFKKNETIFWSLLRDQRSVEPIDKKAEILLGNPDAPFEIAFVSNPFCKPCKNMHSALSNFLVQEKERVRLKIVFTPTFKVNDVINNVIRKLIEIYIHNGVDAFEEAFADWYARGITDPEKWISKYAHTTSKLHEANTIMLMHRDWCEEFNITHTPAVFYNNQLSLPQYSLADIKWFLTMPD